MKRPPKCSTVAFLALLATMVMVSVPSQNLSIANAAPNSEWPVPGQNLQRTFYVDSDAPDAPNLLWKFLMNSVPSGSCIVADGKVFAGCYDTGDVYAVNMSTGQQVWHRNLNNTAYWVAYDGGKIYTSGGTLPHDPVTRVTGDYWIALDANTGNTEWTYILPPSQYASAAVPVSPGSMSVFNGRAYKGNGPGTLVLDADNGTLLDYWTPPYPLPRYNTFYEGDLIGIMLNFTDFKYYLYRADCQTKTIKWTSNRGPATQAGIGPDIGGSTWSMCTASAGNIYVAEWNYTDPRGANRVYRIDAATGAIHWAFSAEGAPFSVATAYNRVFFGTTAGNVYCIDKWTGAYGEIWKFSGAGAIYTDLAIADEKVYFGSMDGYVYCVDAWTGDELWKYRTDGPVTGSPAIADGKLFIAGNDRYIYAFGTPPPKPESSLSISAPSTITSGASATISGKLEDQTGAGVGDAEVILAQRMVPKVEWTNLTTATTNANGEFTYSWTPTIEGYYDLSATYAGDSLASSTSTVTLKVASPPPTVDLTSVTDAIDELDNTISALQSSISNQQTYMIVVAGLVVIAIVVSTIAVMYSRKKS